MNLSDKKATLSFSDGSAPIEFPVYKGTVGPDVIDIRKLYGQTGMFTFDPGFMSTAACESGITCLLYTSPGPGRARDGRWRSGQTLGTSPE